MKCFELSASLCYRRYVGEGGEFKRVRRARTERARSVKAAEVRNPFTPRVIEGDRGVLLWLMCYRK